MCIGKTLNMDSCSKFWGNPEGIWGNPGEIPHIGWKIPGVYRDKRLLQIGAGGMSYSKTISAWFHISAGGGHVFLGSEGVQRLV